MTLLPQPRLLATLVAGSVLFLLLLLSPVFIIAPLVYYTAMAGILVAEVGRLPSKSGFMASRVLPQPFSLGELQSVQLLVAHAGAARLPAEVADHVPADLRPDRRQQAIIAIDCGRLMTAPAGLLSKLDHAVNAALLLAWVAQSQGDKVGMMTFSDSVRRFVAPQRGPAQVTQLNKVLYDIRPEYTEPDFAEAFSHLALRVSRRSLVIVLTDVLDPEASRDLVGHAIRLSHRHLVMVVAMSDPEVLAARNAPIERVSRAYEWAAAEELLSARRASFEQLRQGGVLGLDVEP